MDFQLEINNILVFAISLFSPCPVTGVMINNCDTHMATVQFDKALDMALPF